MAFFNLFLKLCIRKNQADSFYFILLSENAKSTLELNFWRIVTICLFTSSNNIYMKPDIFRSSISQISQIHLIKNNRYFILEIYATGNKSESLPECVRTFSFLDVTISVSSNNCIMDGKWKSFNLLYCFQKL